MKLLKVTASHAKTNDRLVAANPSFHSFFATTFCCPQLRCNARSHKHTFPLPDAHSLFYMPISLRLGPLRFSSLLGITLHNNRIKRLYNCSTKSLA
jgi:hypothetical protein